MSYLRPGYVNMRNISFILDTDEQTRAPCQRLHAHRLYVFQFAVNIEKVLVALFWRGGHALVCDTLFVHEDRDVLQRNQ